MSKKRVGVRAVVKSITLKDGRVEEFPETGVTVIVGPNNAGKSLFLREIAQLVGNRGVVVRNQTLIIGDLHLSKSGTPDEVWEWLLAQGAARRSTFERGEYLVVPQAGEMSRDQIASWWQNDEGLMNLTSPLVGAQMAEQRLGLAHPQQVHNIRSDVPQHPLQRMFSDEALERRLSGLTTRAFGFGISLNRYVQQLDLRIGAPTVALTPPPAPAELLEEFDALPSIDTQGDGVRAFVGLVLHLLLANQPIMIIDEPEAFLHPPQARLLGRLLVENAPSESQLFVATHSSDMLQGVLDARNRDTKILRIERQEAGTTLHPLEPDKVRELWGDPLVRYSQLLDGIFHQATIICEGDADCRWYSAVLDTQTGDERYHDFMFTHVGGKQRLAKGIRALATFGARVGVIADFDVLNNETIFKDVCESSGVEWATVATDFTRMSSAASDHWAELKKSGIGGLDQGDAQAACRRILTALGEHGVFIVPVGELERWVPDVGKVNWILNVLEHNRHETPSDDLAKFVRAVANYGGMEL